MPKTFRLCVKGDCSRSTECLHHMALSLVSPDEPTISVINPAYLAAVKGDCPLFHSATPMRYAQGFVKMLSTLTVAQANALRIRLESHFGHTLYFRLRSSKRLIAPTEQVYIRQVMTKLGVSPLPDFNAYVEAYNW